MFTGINSFWIVENNKPVMKKFIKLNSRNAANSINTFEFQDYILNCHMTNFEVLHKLIDFCFDSGENNFILVNYFGVRWV